MPAYVDVRGDWHVGMRGRIVGAVTPPNQLPNRRHGGEKKKKERHGGEKKKAGGRGQGRGEIVLGFNTAFEDWR